MAIIVGNRIPKDFFVTKGTGESDITVHAGSYHLALLDAGIEMCNIMTYSSILPAIATKMDMPMPITHGEVAETIMSTHTASANEIATAGIIYGGLHDKRTGEREGGLVCERGESVALYELEEQLRASLNELYTNGYADRFELRDIEVNISSFIPTKKYGTALVALVFQSYAVSAK